MTQNDTVTHDTEVRLLPLMPGLGLGTTTALSITALAGDVTTTQPNTIAMIDITAKTDLRIITLFRQELNGYLLLGQKEYMPSSSGTAPGLAFETPSNFDPLISSERAFPRGVRAVVQSFSAICTRESPGIARRSRAKNAPLCFDVGDHQGCVGVETPLLRKALSDLHLERAPAPRSDAFV